MQGQGIDSVQSGPSTDGRYRWKKRGARCSHELELSSKQASGSQIDTEAKKVHVTATITARR